jgi:hypothetical protein
MQEANSKNQPDGAKALAGGINRPVNERRCSRRLPQCLPVEVCVESPFSPEIIRGNTRDITAKGAYFFCKQAFMVGQLLRVTIRLSGGLDAGADRVSLTLRSRVQRVEQLVRNGSKTFGIAVALEK